MKTIIAQTEFYKIEVDTTKNRAYLQIIGFWRDYETVKEYPSQWQKAVPLLEKGFTLLVDLTQMRTTNAQIEELHIEAQKIVKEAGVAMVAEVLSEDFFLALQTEMLLQKSGMPANKFNNTEAAEAYLEAFIAKK